MSFYKDIDLSFEQTSKGDIPSLLDLDTVKQSIYNLLMLSKYENYFDSDFKIDLKNVLHELDDEQTRIVITDAIRTAINNESRVADGYAVDIDFDEALQTYKIVLKILLNNEIDEQEISLILKKTR